VDLNGKNIVVAGMARSGLATALFLNQRGARVTVSDQAPADQFGYRLTQLQSLGIRTELGGHCRQTFTAADLVVISPGVPIHLAPLAAARQAGIEVVAEIELAVRFMHTPLIAVTGTNGKTTTTEMLARMLSAGGQKVFVGGNIGTPLVEYAAGKQTADWVVAEISSFQLDGIKTFRPRVAVLLNVSPDHLDRYDHFDDYVQAKCRIFENQDGDDVAIVNGSDAVIRDHCRIGSQAHRLFWRRPDAPPGWKQGAVIGAGGIDIRAADGIRLRLAPADCRLVGQHNYENVAAAALATLAAGGNATGIRAALGDFAGLPHRLEQVARIHGVRYVNDSKATNVDAVVRALESFSEPILLIMGGRDKDGDFSRLQDPAKRHVREMIVLGEAAQTIGTTLNPVLPGGIRRVDTMDQAVRAAGDLSRPGDVVLLSPGCTSFDMFTDYAQRGDCFRNAVQALAERWE
jgi:UDP-N-acetylmuramoylalanine--D-glutamate ligase